VPLIRLFFVNLFQNALGLFEDDLKVFQQFHLLFRVLRVPHLFGDGEKLLLQLGEFLVWHGGDYKVKLTGNSGLKNRWDEHPAKLCLVQQRCNTKAFSEQPCHIIVFWA